MSDTTCADCVHSCTTIWSDGTKMLWCGWYDEEAEADGTCDYAVAGDMDEPRT